MLRRAGVPQTRKNDKTDFRESRKQCHTRGQDTLRHVTNSPDPIVTRRRTSSPQGETLNGVDLTSPPQGETLNGAVLTSPPQGGNPEKKLDYLFLYNSKTDFLWQIQINYSTAG